MKKSWKLILIALLAALLVCTCMSAIAETETPGHGEVVESQKNKHEGHEMDEKVYTHPSHSSAVQNGNGEWGNWVEETVNVYCATCPDHVFVRSYTRQVFDYCFYGDPIDYEAPTCTSEGYATYECYICHHTVTETLKKLPHSTDGKWIVVKDPTCTEDGYQATFCTVCHEAIETDPIPALGHDMIEDKVIVKPTCTTDGYSADICSRCGYEWTEGRRVLKATGHSDGGKGAWRPSKDATCTTDGYKEYYECTVCNTILSGKEVIPALGHLFDYDTPPEIKVRPTCQEDGYAVSYCLRCEAEQKVVLEKLGHYYNYSVNDPKNTDPKLGWVITTEPTCQHVGYKIITCQRCGGAMEKETLPVVTHSFTKVITNDTATCAKEGKKVTKCIWCGEQKTEIIPKTAHKAAKEWVYDRQAPTCTESMKGELRCENYANCKTVLDTVEIPATGHNLVEYIDCEPTCTVDGWGHRDCRNFEESIGYYCTYREDFVIPATGHDYKVETTPATCTTAGKEVKTCKVCGDVVTTEIPALGHDYQTKTVAATCTTAGSETVACSRCGDVKSSKTIDALGHKAGEAEVTKAATCTEKGVKTTKCTVCGETIKTEEIPALGHKAGEAEVTKAATCTEKGVKTTKCTVCGATLKTEEIAALGHKAGDPVVTAATCTKAGSKVTKCSVCGEVIKTEEIPALGHKEEVTETAATCTKAGSKVTKCSVCGETLKTEEIPALGHKEEVTETAATCTEAGSKVTKCSVCGETLKTEEIPALGHTAGEPVVTPATCTEAGSEVTKCTVCGEVLETKEIPAPGHVPGKEKIEQNMGNTYCTVCGKLLKQRKISSSSSNNNNSGSAAPAASAPVIYNGAINAAGIAASELGGNGSSLVTPIDLSTDGAYTYKLVAGDKYVVGTMTVTVISGKATVTYALKSGVTVSAEGLSIFANAEALKAGTATTAAFNAVIDPAGDTKVILAVNLIGSFDVSIADAYTADAAQIATMKALVD